MVLTKSFKDADWLDVTVRLIVGLCHFPTFEQMLQGFPFKDSGT